MVKTGSRSVELCGINYSEAETGRWKAVDVFTQGSGSKYSQMLTVMNVASFVAFLVGLVIWHISALQYTRFNGSRVWKNFFAGGSSLLILLICLIVFYYYMVKTGQLPVVKSKYLAVLKNSPSQLLKYANNMRNVLITLVFTTLLIPICVLTARFAEDLDTGEISWQRSKNKAEYAIIFTVFAFLVGNIYYAMSSHVASINEIISKYKNAYIDKGLMSDAQTNTLQGYAMRLYNIVYSTQTCPAPTTQSTPNCQLTGNAQVVDVIKSYLKTNIKAIEIVDGDSDSIIDKYKTTLWKYILHNDGIEMQEIVKFFKSYTVGSKTFTGAAPESYRAFLSSDRMKKVKDYVKLFGWKALPANPLEDDVDALNYIGDTVIGVRKLMSGLRRNSDISKLSDNKFSLSLVLLIAYLAMLEYPMYNYYYKQNPAYTTFGVVIMMILLILFTGMTGFVNSARGL